MSAVLPAWCACSYRDRFAHRDTTSPRALTVDDERRSSTCLALDPPQNVRQRATILPTTTFAFVHE